MIESFVRENFHFTLKNFEETYFIYEFSIKAILQLGIFYSNYFLAEIFN